MTLSLPKKLLLATIAVFLVKGGISLFMQGPFIFSDEPCVIQKAIYMLEAGKLETCQNILQVDAGDPHPFYSVFVAAVYAIAKGSWAYHGVLLLNALLVATLIFPLFGIFRRYIQREDLSLLFSVALVFLPQVVAFDSTVMTETLFVVVSVWFSYFYIRSFDAPATVWQERKFKGLALLFAIFAALTRPFGFIVLIALTMNELLVNQDRRSIALVYIPVTVVFTALTMFALLPEIVPQLGSQIAEFKTGTDFMLILSVLKNQLNSFVVTTFVAPILVILMYIRKNDIPLLVKTRMFFIVFIVLNFIIGVQHMLGGDGPTTDLLTRYIAVSLLYIMMLTFIFLTKYRDQKPDVVTYAGTAVVLASLAFLSYQNIKQTLSLDIAVFYDATKSGIANSIAFRSEFLIPLLVIFVAFVALFVMKKYAILRTALIVVLMTQTVMVVGQNLATSRAPAPVAEYFKDMTTSVLFMEAKPEKSTYQTNSVSFDYWRMLVMSPSKAQFRFLLGVEGVNQALELPQEEIDKLAQEFSYVVSTLDLNLPKVATLDARTSGLRTDREYIYALR